MSAKRVSDPMPEARCLDGIFAACRYNGRNGNDDVMREAVRVQTAGLTNEQLRNVILGLSGFVSAAYDYLEGDGSAGGTRA